MQYNYNYDAYQLEHARALSLLEAFGGNNLPLILWNAIPWSFVIDWLVGVNLWLADHGQIEGTGMVPKINICQYLWSIRRRRRTIVSSKITSPKFYAGTGSTETYPPQYITHPVADETAYRRDVSLPSASSIVSSGLSFTEFTLGASLAILHKRKHQ